MRNQLEAWMPRPERPQPAVQVDSLRQRFIANRVAALDREPRDGSGLAAMRAMACSAEQSFGA